MISSGENSRLADAADLNTGVIALLASKALLTSDSSILEGEMRDTDGPFLSCWCGGVANVCFRASDVVTFLNIDEGNRPETGGGQVSGRGLHIGVIGDDGEDMVGTCTIVGV